MTYSHLGRSGLLVSSIGLGTMRFGFTADEKSQLSRSWTPRSRLASTSSTPLMSTAVRSRRTWRRATASRRRSLAVGCKRTGRRDEIVLATKVYQPMGLGPNDRRLSAFHIRRACEASLRRLQTDHIDLYQMHHVDRATPWEEIWQAMEQLVREGKISYVGSSNFAAWDVALAQSAAVEPAFHRLGVRAEPLQPCSAHRGAGAHPCTAEPRHRSHPVQPVAFRSTCWRVASRDRRTQPAMRCSRLSTATALSSKPTRGCAASWARPRRTSRWPGSCRTRSSRRRSSARRRPRTWCRASAPCRCSWTDDVVARLDQIWPGPGEAPQAYAW